MRISIKKIIFLLLFICTGFMSVSGFAASLPLPQDKAFALTTSIKNGNEIWLQWKIAPGYYLYRDRIHVNIDPNIASPIHLPKGKLKRDALVGNYEIYAKQLTIPVFLQTKNQTVQLNVEYQGCSSAKFCYPPVHKSIMLNLADASVVSNNAVSNLNQSSIQSLLTHHTEVASILTHQNGLVTISIFVLLGLLLAFTPCVLPMIPILTGIIAGQKTVSTKKAFFLSLAYVIGAATTYAFAGVAAAAMGNSLQIWLQKPAVIILISGLFVLLAASLFGLYELRLPNRLQNLVVKFSQRQQGGYYASVFTMGMLSSLIVSPCVTAPLAGVLIYIGESGNLLLGAGALFAMGIGMGIPLLLIGTSAGRWLPKTGVWMEIVKNIFGFLMIGMAIWLLSRTLPATIIMLLWGLFLCGIAVFVGFYLPKLIGQQRFNRSLGFIVGVSGILVMVGGVSPDMMNQWVEKHHAAPTFILVNNINELNKQLATARSMHQPVILDFYADWCESCVSMDEHVFQVKTVQNQLSNYVLIRADLTKNTADDEALLKHFNIIAPPTVLFFDAKGGELNSQRIIGEVDAQEFLSRLHNLGNEVVLNK